MIRRTARGMLRPRESFAARESLEGEEEEEEAIEAGVVKGGYVGTTVWMPVRLKLCDEEEGDNIVVLWLASAAATRYDAVLASSTPLFPTTVRAPALLAVNAPPPPAHLHVPAPSSPCSAEPQATGPLLPPPASSESESDFSQSAHRATPGLTGETKDGSLKHELPPQASPSWSRSAHAPLLRADPRFPRGRPRLGSSVAAQRPFSRHVYPRGQHSDASSPGVLHARFSVVVLFPRGM